MNKQKKFIELVNELKHVLTRNKTTKGNELKEIFKEISKNEYQNEIKILLTKNSLDHQVFNVLIRTLMNKKDKSTTIFIKELLINNLNQPQRLIPIIGIIEHLNIIGCGTYLERILDKYYYNDFIKSEDKINYKNTKDITLISSIISALGHIRFNQVNEKLQNLKNYLQFTEPLIGKIAKESLNKMKS